MADSTGRILVEKKWVYGVKMMEPKSHLKGIVRSQAESYNRSDFLRLDKNEDVTGLPEDFITRVLSLVTADMISSYPNLDELYTKLSEYLSIEKEQVLITAGSDAAIKNVFEVYIEPGDIIVLPDPTYAMYEVYANLFQAQIKRIPYDSQLKIDIDELINATEYAKIIAIANPNSPTGTILEINDIIRILDAAKDKGVIVLIDEAYYPYYPVSVIGLINKYSNLIVTRTFSKAFSLASLRLGYAVANPDIIKNMNIFRPIYETNSFAILFGSALLENDQIIQKKVQSVIDGRQYLVHELNKIGLKTYQSHTNFIHIHVGEDNTQLLTDFLFKNGILVKTGFSHETLRQCVRVTIGPIETMDIFLRVLNDFLRLDGGSIPHQHHGDY